MKRTQLLLITVMVLVTSMACSCSFIGFDRLYNSLPNVVVEAGSGVIATREVEVSNVIKEVEIDSIGVLHLTQGEEASLTIEAEDNYIDRIEIEIQDDRLMIKIENEWFNSWVPTQTIHYYLTLPEIEEVQLDGATRLEAGEWTVENLRIECNGTADMQLETMTAENLTVKFAGAGNLNADSVEAYTVTIDVEGVSNVNITDLQAESLTVDIAGGGALSVAGKVNRQDVNIDGSGSYQTGDLRTNTAIINNAGAATITVWVEESLEISCDGAAKVSYYGTPKVHQDNSGFSVIKSLGSKEE